MSASLRAAVLAAAAALVCAVVDVSTYANWPSYPHSLLLETSEFLAEEDPSLRAFWAYVDATFRHANKNLVCDAEASTAAAFEAARPLVHSRSFEVLRLAVLSRAYSPAVEFTRQLGLSTASVSGCRDGTSWAEVHTGDGIKYACTGEQLSAAIDAAAASGRAAPATAASTTVPFDRFYPAESAAAAIVAETTAPLVIVYGSLGDAQRAGALHTAASAAAAAGRARYVWRHFPVVWPACQSSTSASETSTSGSATGSASATWLAGYGVTIDLKSTEYKFMDTDRTKGAAEADEGEGSKAEVTRLSALAAADSTLASVGALTPQEAAASIAAQAAAGTGTGKSVIAGVDMDALLKHYGTSGNADEARKQLEYALTLEASSGNFSGSPLLSLGVPVLTEGSAASGGTSKLQPWELSRLGDQAVAYIMDALALADLRRDATGTGEGSTDPLARLVALTGNLPSLAGWLSNQPVPVAVTRELQANRERALAASMGMGGMMMGNPHGGVPSIGASVSLNGISIDPSSPSFNIFSLLNVLREEAHIVGQIDALPVATGKEKARVMALAVAGSDDAIGAAAAAAAAEAGTASTGSGDDNAQAASAGASGGARSASALTRSVRVDVYLEEGKGKGAIRSVPYVDDSADAGASASGNDGQGSKRDSDDDEEDDEDEEDEEEGSGKGATSVFGRYAHPHPIVHWLNDFESAEAASDPHMRRWHHSLTGLLQQMGWQLPAVRRNVFNLLLIADYGTAAAQKALLTAAQITAQRMPVRMGVLPLPGSSAAEAADLGAAVKHIAALRAWAAKETAARAAGTGTGTGKNSKASKAKGKGKGSASNAAPTIPRSLPSSDTPATGLDMALLHASVLTKHGAQAATLYVQQVATAWRAAAERTQQQAVEAAQAAASASGSPPPTEQALMASVQAAIEKLRLSVGEAQGAYASVVSQVTGAWTRAAATDEATEALTDSNGHLRLLILRLAQWVGDRGLLSSAPCMVLNGRVRPGLEIQQEFGQSIAEELGTLQKAIQAGQLDDSVSPSVYAALMGRASRLSASQARAASRAQGQGNAPPRPLLPGSGLVVPRHHPVVFADEERQSFLPLSAPQYAPLVSHIRYVHAPGTSDEVKPVSLTLFADAGSEEGLQALAAAVAWVAVPPSNASEAEGLSGLPLAPAAVTSLAKSVRVGLVHIPAVPVHHSSGSSATSSDVTLGSLVEAIWALATGTAPSAVSVRPDEQCALLSLVARLALQSVREDGEEGASRGLLKRLQAALLPSTEQAQAILKPRVAQKLIDASTAFLEGASASGASASASAPAWRSALVAHQALAAKLATSMVLETDSQAAAISAAGTGKQVLRITAVAANGRVLPLVRPGSTSSSSSSSASPFAGLPESVQTALASVAPLLASSEASSEGGDGSGGLSLPLSPSDLAVLIQHERAARGAGVVSLLSSLQFAHAQPTEEGSSADDSAAPFEPLQLPPSPLQPLRDPDDQTADWMSGVVMAASSAVGSSLNVQSGSAGGRVQGRQVLRTSHYASGSTAFVTKRVRSADGASSRIVSVVGGSASLLASASASGEGSSDSSESGRLGLAVTAIVDPLSEEAAHVAPLLQLLRDRCGATVRVHLITAQAAYTDLPIKSFYRFVMPADHSPSPSHSTRSSLPTADAAASASSYAVASASGSSGATSQWQHPRAVFSWLPPSAILTFKLQVPEPWNTQTALADVDLDNTRLADVPRESTSVAYRLKDVLVAGQCMDETSRSFPNGLQLVLTGTGNSSTGSLSEAPVSDTLVMQNLGYWQLKARPGAWRVQLAEGRARELYSIVGTGTGTGSEGSGASPSASSGDAAASAALAALLRHTRASTGTSSGTSGYSWGFYGRRSSTGSKSATSAHYAQSLPVYVRDFTGPITHLSVEKRPGKEHIALLDAIGQKSDADGAGAGSDGSNASGGGLWGAVSRTLFGGSSSSSSSGSKALVAPTTTATTMWEDEAADSRPFIHVFSLASGHLYERFLKIMMLSASKRSPTSRLKFWLVENFLSPQFKQSIEALALTHHFSVGYVTYKWPNWLRGQTEKQRLIWGYKILFLDVLFPLNVTRVIYVDSDQVVRSDLKELWEMDLQGAPYAYTPFCTSRAETLGYQFWRQGYWADHLRGKPYHISALYVVDLVAFRRAAVGDTLRAVYDNLSRDPNSLSNLDQDLPNYAQHMVPIHSLPQEWLWCESWCSDDSKAGAKTIDLCNNPRYKEPKLDMAKRVISGPLFPESWVQLDEEAAKAEAEWKAQQASAYGAVAAGSSGSSGSGRQAEQSRDAGSGGDAHLKVEL